MSLLICSYRYCYKHFFLQCHFLDLACKDVYLHFCLMYNIGISKLIKKTVMNITKNNQIYKISDSDNKWVAKLDYGNLQATFDIPKNVCKTFDKLKEYILSNDIF